MRSCTIIKIVRFFYFTLFYSLDFITKAFLEKHKNLHAGPHAKGINMKKTIIASLIGLAYATPIFAAEDLTIDNVVVTASRIEQPRESVIADVTIINKDEIERAGQSSLVELLQLQPAVEISNNGGAGKTSNIFLRGASSNQTLILIDGLRIQSATTGTTTLENLSLAQIDRIEILRGPATSLYGQDAIGGVIQIFTKKSDGDFNAYASAGYGTYNTSRGTVGVSGRGNDTSYAINLSAEDTDGFSALDTNNPNLDDDDGYRNLSVNGSVTHDFNLNHQIGFQFFNSQGDTRFDNRFNTTDFSSNANIDQQAVAIFSRHQFTDFWTSKLKFGFSQDKLDSFDEFNAPMGSQFDTQQKQLNWQNDLKLPVGTLTLMYERLEEEVTSNTDFNETERNNDAYVVSYLANVGPHSIQLSYRDDHNSAFDTQNTGGAGYGYRFNDNWQATASYGKAFRAPTFNDLYFSFSRNISPYFTSSFH